MQVLYKLKLITIAAFLGLTSCNDKEPTMKDPESKSKYFVRTFRERDDTLLVNKWPVPDTTFHISVKKFISTSLGDFEINKFTNEPGAPTDGGMELFYEKNLGMFYSRSLTWPEYTRVHSNDQSLNAKISLLVDRVLSDPELCNYPVFDTSKSSIKKFVTPKIE